MFENALTQHPLFRWAMATGSRLAGYSTALLVLAFMLKCLLVSGYCLLLYGGVRLVKNMWGYKLSVRANYYIWYTLLLSFPLSGLGFNNRIKLPFYDLFFGIYFYPTLDMETAGWLIIISHLLRLLLLFATGIWLVVILVKCLRQTVTNIWLWRAIRCQKVFQDQHGLKQQSAAAFRMRAEKIQVVAADFINSPVSYGVFRKTILLPHDYDSRYTPSELYLLLLHEMGHLKNRDTVKLQLLDIVACFVWPVRLMKKHFIRDSEILCDNRVLGVRQGEQTPYGELIVRELSAQNKVIGLGFSDSYQTVKSRLEAIYSRKPEKHHIAAFSVAVALLLAGSAAYAAGHPAPWLDINTEGASLWFDQGDFDIYVSYIDDGRGPLSMGTFETSTLSAQYIPFQAGMDHLEWGASFKERNKTLENTFHHADDLLVVDKVAVYAYLEPYIREGFGITEVVFIKQAALSVNTRRDSLLWDGLVGQEVCRWRPDGTPWTSAS